MIDINPHIREHMFYYASMAILQFVGFLLILAASPHVQLQMILVVLTSGLYFFWAILHHFLHHDLHPKVVIEYLLIGLFGISVSFFLFQMQ